MELMRPISLPLSLLWAVLLRLGQVTLYSGKRTLSILRTGKNPN